MAWSGKALNLVVYAYDSTTPISGATFTLTNTQSTDDTEDDVVVWSGTSNAEGMISIPWGPEETTGGNAACFAGNSSYVLKLTVANDAYVLPAGFWTVDIGMDNTVSWTTTQSTESAVNRTLSIGPVDEDGDTVSATLGSTFNVYNDLQPSIVFNANGGELMNDSEFGELSDDHTVRTVTVDFTATETSHVYAITETNPICRGYVFANYWATWPDKDTEIDGVEYEEYYKDDQEKNKITFYRDSDNDDVTLYAQWEPVVAKITDRNDNLLYVNGSPAVYMTLAEAFEAFNTASFTTSTGSTANQRKIKMLVGEYTLTQPVELKRGKTAVLTTAATSDNDLDGYPGPYTGEDSSVCVITRGYDYDSDDDEEADTVTASMITNNNYLTLMNITLDGGNLTYAGNGGIVSVMGNYSQLMVAEGTTLRNSTVVVDAAKEEGTTGFGGAIYAAANTAVTLSGGSITSNSAANGGAMYALGTVNVTGGEITANHATVNNDGEYGLGGGLYVGGRLTMSNGTIGANGSANTAASGAGVYLAGTGSFTGGTIAYNIATTAGGGVYAAADVSLSGTAITNNTAGNSTAAGNGGGVYMDGASLTMSTGVIRANSASALGDEGGLGGGVYIGTGASIAMSGGSIGGTAASDKNEAASGAGVYLAADSSASTFTGGAIAYNTASGNGGGLYTAKNVTLSGVNVANNGAGNTGNAGYGGGVYVNDATLTLSSGNIRANTASASNGQGGFGGGVYVDNTGSLIMSGGTVGGTTATYGNHAANGAGVYLAGSESSYATFTLSSGSLTNNRASGQGGAVYADDYAQMTMSGGSISLNRANGTNGGAINVEGEHSRLYFSGSPVIFNNPASAATTAQKNVVLSEDYNTVINTDETGLTGGTIGVYVVDTATTDSSTIYNKHGLYNKPFGTYDEADSKRDNAMYFRNDRNMALYGMPNDEDPGTVYWLNVVCKITSSSDALLYERKTVNEVTAYYPAVYDTVKGGFTATGETLYRRSGSAYVVYNGALKLKMLEDYELDGDEVISYSTDRNLTFTTAETDISKTMSSNGDVYIYVPASTTDEETGETNVTGDPERATLTRAQTTGSMFTVNNASHSFTMTGLIIDGNDTETTVDGGIFHVEAGELIVGSGAKLTKSKATNGGAVYVAANAVMTMTGGEITGCEAASGGAGIYLAEGSTLKLSGSPSFGGTGRKTDDVDSQIITEDDDGNPIGNFTTGVTLSDDALNGQKAYTKARQDIFLEGYADEEGHEGETPATSIVLTGALDVPNGSIWVWAGDPAHYEMLKQFAVFESTTVKSAMTSAQLEKSYAAFRNAWDDESTGCGADYLTGQEGDDLTDEAGKTWKCIYWTGGFDFVFRKIDGDGIALDGAEFTLYMSTKDSGGNYVPATNATSGAMIAYQQTDKVNGGKKNATATSGKGTQTDPLAGTNEEHAVVIKVNTGTEDNPVLAVPDPKVYGKGLAVFEKIPPGVYFIKETTDANGIATIGGKKYKPVEEMHMVDINGKGFYTFYVATLADDGTTTWVKDDAHKAPMETLSVGSDTVDVPVALNVSAGSRKVVLRKVENSTTNPYGSIKSAVFDVYYADKQTVVKLKHTTTTVVNGVSTTTTTVEALQDLASKNSGAFWMGELPCGTYYIEETDSAGYKMPTHFFVLEVTDSGVMTKEISESSNAADLVPTDD